MNKRSILAAVATGATGLALTVGTVDAQSADDTEGVKAASKAFYAALNTGSVEMFKVYAKTPYVTYINPAMKIRAVGWDNVKSAVEGSWGEVPTRAVEMTNSRIQVRGTLAWENGDELGTVQTQDGSKHKIDSAAANVYENIDGQWLIVSHHAQPRPQ